MNAKQRGAQSGLGPRAGPQLAAGPVGPATTGPDWAAHEGHGAGRARRGAAGCGPASRSSAKCRASGPRADAHADAHSQAPYTRAHTRPRGPNPNHPHPPRAILTTYTRTATSPLHPPPRWERAALNRGAGRHAGPCRRRRRARRRAAAAGGGGAARDAWAPASHGGWGGRPAGRPDVRPGIGAPLPGSLLAPAHPPALSLPSSFLRPGGVGEGGRGGAAGG